MTTEEKIALANVFATAAGPVVVLVLALIADRRFKNIERSIEERRRVSDTRFELYKEIGFQLNDLFVYFMYRGNWKDHTPHDMIRHKRELDRHIFTYAPLFSEKFSTKYNAFILSCFKMYGGWRKDARLRTQSKYRVEAGDTAYADCFTEEDNKAEIERRYKALMTALADELGVGSSVGLSE